MRFVPIALTAPDRLARIPADVTDHAVCVLAACPVVEVSCTRCLGIFASVPLVATVHHGVQLGVFEFSASVIGFQDCCCMFRERAIEDSTAVR